MSTIHNRAHRRKTHTPCPLSNTLCDFIGQHHTTPPFAFAFLSHVLSSRKPKPITWQRRTAFPGTHRQHRTAARLTDELIELNLVHLARSYKRPASPDDPGRCNEYIASRYLLQLQAQGSKLYPTWSRYLNRKPLKPQPQPPATEDWAPDLYETLLHITTNPLLKFDRTLAYTLAEPRYNVLVSFANTPPGPVSYGVRPATSGRIQTFRPNLQGLPRSLRPAVKPLGEGMLAYIDVRQAEPRVLPRFPATLS